MEILGITAEYNPFHKGHRYQLDQARKLVNPDCVVVAMSGDFVQRGETAILSKWERSRDALAFGADLVFELPFIFACNRAEFFAAGAVDTLVMAGAGSISFGCECSNPDELLFVSEEISNKSKELSEFTGRAIREGMSHAKAYGQAVRTVLGDHAADLITMPNNILAVEYLKRIKYWTDRGHKVKSVPVIRYGSGYYDVNHDTAFAGAGEIRKMIYENADSVSSFLPEGTSAWSDEENFYSAMAEDMYRARDRMFVMLKGEVLRSSPEQLQKIFGVREGLENRIKNEIIRAADYKDFLSRVVSGRYTASAVRRIFVWILMGTDRKLADSLLQSEEGFMPRYLRLLAAGKKGREYLRLMAGSEHAKGRIITNVNRLNTERAPEIREMLNMDILAADIYNCIHGKRIYDYSDRVVRPYIET